MQWNFYNSKSPNSNWLVIQTALLVLAKSYLFEERNSHKFELQKLLNGYLEKIFSLPWTAFQTKLRQRQRFDASLAIARNVTGCKNNEESGAERTGASRVALLSHSARIGKKPPAWSHYSVLTYAPLHSIKSSPTLCMREDSVRQAPSSFWRANSWKTIVLLLYAVLHKWSGTIVKGALLTSNSNLFE